MQKNILSTKLGTSLVVLTVAMSQSAQANDQIKKRLVEQSQLAKSIEQAQANMELSFEERIQQKRLQLLRKNKPATSPIKQAAVTPNPPKMAVQKAIKPAIKQTKDIVKKTPKPAVVKKAVVSAVNAKPAPKNVINGLINQVAGKKAIKQGIKKPVVKTVMEKAPVVKAPKVDRVVAQQATRQVQKMVVPKITGKTKPMVQLNKKETKPSQEKQLKNVFTSTKRYSQPKKGTFDLTYAGRYSHYRDSRIDIATENDSSRIMRFRVEEDAQHTLTNSLSAQYAILDNLNVSATIPFIAKTDFAKNTQTGNLGDVDLGVRYEPLPLKEGRMPLTLSANVSLPTGVSPYTIDTKRTLATGKGYYSVGAGLSTRKYVDPVVLFASANANYGIPRSDLEQSLGNGRTLVGIAPNLNFGLSAGFAYSLSYDVSINLSYQQGFSMGSKSTIKEPDVNDATKLITRTVDSPVQSSSNLNLGVGVRVSPETIINTSVGIGLTEDTPDVSLGVSLPISFTGLAK